MYDRLCNTVWGDQRHLQPKCLNAQAGQASVGEKEINPSGLHIWAAHAHNSSALMIALFRVREVPESHSIDLT